MVYDREALESLTRPDLLEIAANVYEVDLPTNMSKPDLVSELLELQRMNEALNEDDGEPGGQEPDEDVKPKKEKLYNLILNSDDKAGGNAPLPVGVNGKVWAIPRDIEVQVPESVATILRESVITITEEKGTDKDGKPIYKDRNVRRFSFSLSPVET